MESTVSSSLVFRMRWSWQYRHKNLATDVSVYNRSPIAIDRGPGFEVLDLYTISKYGGEIPLPMLPVRRHCPNGLSWTRRDSTVLVPRTNCNSITRVIPPRDFPRRNLEVGEFSSTIRMGTSHGSYIIFII